jgi:hypothetical protein
LSRDKLPLRADFFIFFRRVIADVVVNRSGVLTSFPYSGANPRGCTTHVLRFQHHLGDDCRATLRVSSATEKSCRTLVPSYSKAWLRVVTRQLVSGSGEGQHTQPEATLAVLSGARAGVQSKRKGSGISGLGVPERSTTQPGKALSTLASGSSFMSPVRRRAHPLCSLRTVGKGSYQKPFCA